MFLLLLLFFVCFLYLFFKNFIRFCKKKDNKKKMTHSASLINWKMFRSPRPGFFFDIFFSFNSWYSRPRCPRDWWRGWHRMNGKQTFKTEMTCPWFNRMHLFGIKNITAISRYAAAHVIAKKVLYFLRSELQPNQHRGCICTCMCVHVREGEKVREKKSEWVNALYW